MDPCDNMSLTEVKRSHMNTGGQNLTSSFLYFLGLDSNNRHVITVEETVIFAELFFNISAFYLVLLQSFCGFSFDKVL